MSITITNNSVFFDKNDIVSSDGSVGTTEGFRTVISGDLSPLKNRIINGDMTVNQRYTGTRVATAGSYPVIVDRFRLYNSTATSYINASRVSWSLVDGPPEGQQQGIRCTTLVSGWISGTADHIGLYTTIEGYDFLDFFYGTANNYGNEYSASTQPCPGILSFWVRSSTAGNYSVSFRNESSNRVLVQRFRAEQTWRKIFIFVPPCGDGTWNTSNGGGIYINWNLAIGDNTYRASTNEIGYWTDANYLGMLGQDNIVSNAIGTTFDITGVQFEKCIAPAMPCWIVKGSPVTANGTTGLTPLYSGDDDDNFRQITLPFPVTYLGKTYNDIYVGTNGYISFGSGSTRYPSALTNNSSPVVPPHLGFFKGDKRLVSLHGGQVTKTLGSFSTSNAYIVRWEGYNYSGSSSNRTIVEIWFYQLKLNDNNIIDVVYVQNQNTTQGNLSTAAFLEVNDEYTGNGSGTYYPLQFIANKDTGTSAYRIVMPPAKVVKSSGTDLYWNSSANLFDYSVSLPNLTSDEIYTRIGASTYNFTDKHTEFLKCQRYYQKTYAEATNEGANSATHGGVGLYPYYRDGTASTVSRYIPYIYSGEMRHTPSVAIYDYEGNANKASSDGVSNTYSASPSAIGTSACFVYFTSSMPSHYSLYAFVTLDAEM